jgi:hypothetical protein
MSIPPTTKTLTSRNPACQLLSHLVLAFDHRLSQSALGCSLVLGILSLRRGPSMALLFILPSCYLCELLLPLFLLDKPGRRGTPIRLSPAPTLEVLNPGISADIPPPAANAYLPPTTGHRPPCSHRGSACRGGFLLCPKEKEKRKKRKILLLLCLIRRGCHPTSFPPRPSHSLQSFAHRSPGFLKENAAKTQKNENRGSNCEDWRWKLGRSCR